MVVAVVIGLNQGLVNLLKADLLGENPQLAVDAKLVASSNFSFFVENRRFIKLGATPCPAAGCSLTFGSQTYGFFFQFMIIYFLPCDTYKSVFQTSSFFLPFFIFYYLISFIIW